MKRLRAILTTTLALSALAAGQVSITQTGRELDANTRVGSGGVNTPRLGTPQGDIFGNLYVTGQVTAGRSFRGDVPYSASNQLSLTLPSQSVDNFTRDSVGLNTVARGGVFAPQPYYSLDRTVLGAGAIAAGQAAPGTNVPRTTTLEGAAVSQRLYRAAVVDYAPLLSPQQTGVIRVDEPSVVSAAAIASALRPEGAVRPQTSGLFGLLSSQQTEQVAEQLMNRMLADDPEALRAGGEQSLVPAAERVGEPVEESTAPTATPMPQVQPIPDQDIFIDMLYALAQRRAQQGAGPTVNLPGTPFPDDDGFGQDMRESQYSQAVVESTHQQIILHGLAGRQPDAFNRFMELGDRRLREGKFYEAAGNYETARVIRRDNPLAAVGAGLSYLAAGEARTAAYYLTLAMELFPPLMEVKLDLDRIGGSEAVAERLEEIRARLTEPVVEADIGLVFLLSYANWQLERTEAARQWAAKLQAAAGDQPIYAAFARYVLTGQRPAQASQAAAPTAP